MAEDLKAATPDASFPSGAVLFGADSQAATSPSVYAQSTVWDYWKTLANTWSATQTFVNVVIGSSNTIAWSTDLFLARDAANTLALRNSTAAQTFNVYNTYTDASNYSRAYIKFSGNNILFGGDAAGTGASSGVALQANATTRFDYNVTVANWFACSGYNFYVGNNSASAGFAVELDGSGFANSVVLGSGTGLAWSSSVTANPNTLRGNGDTILNRAGAGIVTLRGAGSTSPGAFNFYTYNASPPSAPSSSQALIYADTSGGKIRLMALFPSGAAQQIAIEP